MKNLKERIQLYKEDMLNDIASLVEIPSVMDKTTSKENAPFGIEVSRSFDCFNEIASRLNFDVTNHEGYAIAAQLGEGSDYIGILAHLDVVGIMNRDKWLTSPYEMKVIDNIMYGRGVNDDKGPLIAALYAMKIVEDMKVKLKYPVRLIAGGAEETTWECMKYYFSKNQQPVYAFSPDGNFPIVNGEKGILQTRYVFNSSDDEIEIKSKNRVSFVCDQLEVMIDNGVNLDFVTHAASITKEEKTKIVYEGTTALSRNPQRGDNAIFKFVKDFVGYTFKDSALSQLVQLIHDEFLDDFYGEKSGLYAIDESMGTTSHCLMSITWNTDVKELCMDTRTVKSTTIEACQHRLEEIAHAHQATVEVINMKPLLFVDETNKLIQSLKAAYYSVMNEEAEVLTKGGASYARTLDNGVAFGATFEGENPNPHMPNENMSVDSLLKACEIYVQALLKLGE